jgi:hypothetical protein
MRWPAALFGLLFATATASCAFLLDFDELSQGGPASDAGDGGLDASVPLEDLSARYAEALCDHLRACMGASAPLFFADEDCVDLFRQRIQDSIVAGLPALPDSTFSYHGELVPACLDAVRGASCEQFFPQPEACDQALEGKVESGGPCTHPAQCKRGQYCKVDKGCPGTCAPKPGEGEPCASGTCAEGLSCDETLGCVKLVTQEGGECGGGVAPRCAPDKFCLGALDGQAGHCTRVSSLFTTSQVGGKCDWNDGPLCVEGLRCQLTAPAEVWSKSYGGTCVEEIPAGAACQIALPDPCSKNYYCPGLGGTCTALPKQNDLCAKNSLVKPGCMAETRCVQINENEKRCNAFVNLGQACADDVACASGNCVAGICAQPNYCVIKG